MKIRGRLQGVSKDWAKNVWVYSFCSSVQPTEVAEELNQFGEKLLDIEVKKHSERRSLSANSYFHALLSQIADKLGESKTAVKNSLICRYGQPMFVADEIAVIKTQIPPEQMREADSLHCKPMQNRHENGKDIYFYQVYRGSSDLDSKEMAILIDGTISEAKDLGIQTITDSERNKMIESWASQS